MKCQRIEHQIFQAPMSPLSPEKMTPKSLTNSNPYKICKQQFFFDAAGVKAAGQQKKDSNKLPQAWQTLLLSSNQLCG